MTSIFGIPVQWLSYLQVWMGHKNGVAVKLRRPSMYRDSYWITLEWKDDSIIDCYDKTMQGVLSQARKELVKTGHRVFGGKS